MRDIFDINSCALIKQICVIYRARGPYGRKLLPREELFPIRTQIIYFLCLFAFYLTLPGMARTKFWNLV